MNNSCDYHLNFTCWRRFVSNINWEWSITMVPVEIMMSFFMLVGVVGNTLVILVYSRRRQKTSATIFMLFLACIDLFACVFLHPYVIYKLFHYFDQTWATVCKVFEYCNHCTLSVSGLTLLLVAIDRYLAICQPVKFLTFDKHVKKGIFSVALVSVVFSLPVLEFYGSAPYRLTEFNSNITGFCCHYKDEYKSSKILAMYGTTVMCLFLLVIIAMIILYKHVAVTAYQSLRVVRPLSNAHILAGLKPSVSSDTNIEIAIRRNRTFKCKAQTKNMTQDICALNGRSRGQNREEPTSSQQRLEHNSSNVQNRSDTGPEIDNISSDLYRNDSDIRNLSVRLKAAKMLFFVTAVFFLSWMPFFILRVCETVAPNYWNDRSVSKYVLQHLLNHVFYLNNAANPIIYTIINKTFRKDCKMLFGKHFDCCC